MEYQTLITEIREYCDATNQAPSTFCLRVANNGTLYGRLVAGGGCAVSTLEKIRTYIAENPPKEGQDA